MFLQVCDWFVVCLQHGDELIKEKPETEEEVKALRSVDEDEEGRGQGVGS